MVYKDVSLMLQGLIDTLEDGDVVVRADNQLQLLIGFRVDRPGKEDHMVTLTTVKLRKGVSEAFEDLIYTGAGRDHMARAMTHRHQFKDHGCAECAVWEVMES